MKRGSSHLEMIISFILFFSFLFFLFIYLQPTSDVSLSKSVHDGLRDSFKQEVSTELASFFVRVESKGNFSILLDNRISSIDFQNAGVLVKDINGNQVDAGLKQVQDDIFSLSVDGLGGSYYVYISPDFNNTFFGGNLVKYNMGDVYDRQLLSMKKIEKLADKYEADYEGLKKDLKVPVNFDFAISGVVEMEGNVPENVEVFARSYIEDVLMTNGEVESKKIT
ncbi:MAG: hypothetical protein ACP5D2_00570, partial [Candidatus Nanoarchaeia archaeon]